MVWDLMKHQNTPLLCVDRGVLRACRLLLRAPVGLGTSAQVLNRHRPKFPAKVGGRCAPGTWDSEGEHSLAALST